MAHSVLVPISQKGPLKEIPIFSNKFSLGRGLNNNYVAEDVNVSRTHCVLEYRDNKWYISDVSSNGTWLNGNLIDKSRSHVLATGDIIGLSESFKFVFKLQSDEGTRVVGKSTKRALSDDDILNIAESVIADVEAFQAECNSENFDDSIFNNAPNELMPTTLNQAGSSSTTLNPMIVNNESVGVNNEEQPIMAYVIQPCSINVKQDISESHQVPVPLPLDPNACAGTSAIPQLEPEPPNISSQNVPVQPQLNNLDFVEEELQCSICTEMFVQAVTLSCSHSFCKYCIDQWQRNQKFCPICRQKITSQIPTRVIDNYIEKTIENASDTIKQHRQELIEQRQSQTTTPVVATSSASTGIDSIEISSAEENDDEDEDDYDDHYYDQDIYDEDMSNYSDSDESVEYNGLPDKYYGGYGHCYTCGDRGHWANGCPNR